MDFNFHHAHVLSKVLDDDAFSRPPHCYFSMTHRMRIDEILDLVFADISGHIQLIKDPSILTRREDWDSDDIFIRDSGEWLGLDEEAADALFHAEMAPGCRLDYALDITKIERPHAAMVITRLIEMGNDRQPVNRSRVYEAWSDIMERFQLPTIGPDGDEEE